MKEKETEISGVRDSVDAWSELCDLAEAEAFEPVSVDRESQSVRFDYHSRREQAWMLGAVFSLVVAVVLAFVFSLPIIFLVTLCFVGLLKATDDHYLLDKQERGLFHVRTFFGKNSGYKVADFQDIKAVHLVPTEHRTGQTSWTEYWLSLEDSESNTHPFLIHPDARAEKRSHRFGEAVAHVLDVPLIKSARV